MSAWLQRLDDGFSPMLVKELRQGIKSRAFVFSFLLLQGLMVFCVLMYVGAGDDRSSIEFFDFLFWMCVAAPLVFIMPFRAFQSVQAEVKEKTLELIFLTRLSAWRIVLGKWASLFTQSLLLASAILPYAVLRYFLGSINLVEDMLALGGLLCASAILTAGGVSCSTFRAPLFRTLFVIGMILSINVLPVLALGGMRSALRGSPATPLTLIAVVVFTVLLALLALQWGAGRIAPAAENHERGKRITALLLVLAAFVFAKLGARENVLYLALVFLVPVCVDALLDHPRALPAIYAPFVRRGRWGRLLGRYLYPGWPSGLLYSLLVLSLLFVMIGAEKGFRSDFAYFFASLVGAICAPLAVVLLARPRGERLLAWYFLLQIGLVVITTVAFAVHAVYPRVPIELLSLIPTSAFVLLVFDHNLHDWLPVTAIVSAASVIALALMMWRPWRDIRRMEDTVAARLRDEAVEPPRGEAVEPPRGERVEPPRGERVEPPRGEAVEPPPLP